MPDFSLSTIPFAASLCVSRQTINEILRERRAITPIMALRLSRLFGNTPHFWINAQHSRDIWESENLNREKLDKIHPLKTT
jgi:addiction module HigA family antidote